MTGFIEKRLGVTICDLVEPLRNQIEMRLHRELVLLKDKIDSDEPLDELFDLALVNENDAIKSYLDLFCTYLMKNVKNLIEEIEVETKNNVKNKDV